MPVILFLSLQYLVMVRTGVLRKIMVAGVAFAVVLSFFLLLQRFSFVFTALMIVAFLYYGGTSLRPMTLLIGGSAFAGFLLYIRSFRVAVYIENYLHVMSRMKYPAEYAIFSEPYMYVVMNFENFARSVDKLDFHTFGFFSLDFLFAMTGLKHPLIEYFHLVERPFIYSGFNTSPFLWPYFYDFGIIGVVMAPFIIGAVIAVLYNRLRTAPSVRSAGLYAIAFSIMVLMFFTNLLTSLNAVVNIVVWLAAIRMITVPVPAIPPGRDV
jgi:oligosaccharide repeat unit polymerase